MMTLEDVLKHYQTHPDFLGILLVDPNQPGAVDDTPLHIACRKGALEDAKILIAHGGDINLAGDLGNSPLHHAALTGRLAVVEYLVGLNADVSKKNEFSQTALDVARLGGHQEVVQFLEKTTI